MTTIDRTTITPPTPPNGDNSDSVNALVAQLLKILSGPISKEDLKKFLSELREAMKDPKMAALLAEQGITPEMLDSLEKNLNGDGKFDYEAWLSLFDKLGVALNIHSFGLASTTRLTLIEFATIMIGQHIEDNAEQNEKAGLINDLIALLTGLTPDENGEYSFTKEMVEKLKAAGITADDVDDPKLKVLLNGADPQTIKFTKEEIDKIESDLTEKARDLTSGIGSDLLLELQRLKDLHKITVELMSAILKTSHDVQMKSIDNISSS